jgi:hypothetical protein
MCSFFYDWKWTHKAIITIIKSKKKRMCICLYLYREGEGERDNYLNEWAGGRGDSTDHMPTPTTTLTVLGYTFIYNTRERERCMVRRGVGRSTHCVTVKKGGIGCGESVGSYQEKLKKSESFFVCVWQHNNSSSPLTTRMKLPCWYLQKESRFRGAHVTPTFYCFIHFYPTWKHMTTRNLLWKKERERESQS